LSGMLAAPDLDGGAGRFLRERTFAAITARDRLGRLWTSPLVGARGFLDGHRTTLHLQARPAPGDPLRDLAAGQAVGLVAIDLAKRRRIRVNGQLVVAGEAGYEIDVGEAYGNCPQYIHPREPDLGSAAALAHRAAAQSSTGLTDEQIALIRRADTFFLGTLHPDRGADASHRGGPSGFVRVDDDGHLWWPDYPGNNMFNSLGNLVVDPTAAALFIDFATGATVHVSGAATVEWITAGGAGDDGGTGRRVRLAVHHVVG
jgi:predicted pyridoxine 5'-phosphate oxidase superfamily flavin-nucleotide-binding protein